MLSLIWLDTNYISISFEFKISKGSLSPAGRAVAAVCWWPDIKGTSMSGTRSMCPGQVGWLRWGGSTTNSCAVGPGSWTVGSFVSRGGAWRSAGDVSTPWVCVARGDDSCCFKLAAICNRCDTVAELRWRGLIALSLAEQFVFGRYFGIMIMIDWRRTEVRAYYVMGIYFS